MGTRSRRNKEAAAAERVASRGVDSGEHKQKKKKGKKGRKGQWGTAQWVGLVLGVFMGLGTLVSIVGFFTDDGGVVEIDVTDRKLLKEVFYGGEPWVVLCEDPGADHKRKFFDQAARKLRDKQINSGVMDCKVALPTGTGENTRKRFGLKRSVGDPVIIMAANGRKPRQVPKSAVKEMSVKKFTDYVRKQTQAVVAGPITRKNDWAARCLKSKACVTVYTPKDMSNEMKYLHQLAAMNRDVQFVYMNSSQYRVAVGGSELKFRSALQGSSLSLFVKEKLGPDEERRMHYFYQEDFDIDSLDAILQKYKTGHLDMTLLAEDAKISLKKRKRKTKAQREAAARRKKRKEEQQQQKKKKKKEGEFDADADDAGSDSEKKFRRRRRARIKAEREAKRAADEAAYARRKAQEAAARGEREEEEDDDEYENEDDDEINLDAAGGGSGGSHTGSDSNDDADDADDDVGSSYAQWQAAEAAGEQAGEEQQQKKQNPSAVGVAPEQDEEALEQARRAREARARERMAREQQEFIPEEIPEDEIEGYDDDDDDDDDDAWMNIDGDDDEEDDEDEIEL